MTSLPQQQRNDLELSSSSLSNALNLFLDDSILSASLNNLSVNERNQQIIASVHSGNTMGKVCNDMSAGLFDFTLDQSSNSLGMTSLPYDLGHLSNASSNSLG